MYTSNVQSRGMLSSTKLSLLISDRSFPFLSSSQLPSQLPRQTLHDNDILTNHPPHLTDSFTLYLKSILIGARVATFNARMKMERESKIKNGLLPPEAAFNPAGMFSSMRRLLSPSTHSHSREATSTGSSPSGLGDYNGSSDASSSADAGHANTLEGMTPIRDLPAFQRLQDDLAAFRASFPPPFADAIKPALYGSSSPNGGGRSLKSVDGALYLAHAIAAL